MPNQLHLEAEAVKWKRRLDATIRVLVIMMACAVGSSLYLTTVSINRVEQLTQDNKKLNKITLQNSSILIDCTTPGGKCFEQNQRRTGQVVVNLNEVTKIATICADRPGSISLEEMEACIKTELERVKE
jgi:hypothetical protein